MSAPEEPSPGKDKAQAKDGPSPAAASTNASAPHTTVKKELGNSEMSNGKVGEPNPAEISIVIGGGEGGGGGGGLRRSQAENPSKKSSSTSVTTASPPATVKKEPGTAETSNGKVGEVNSAEICVVIGGSEGGAGGPRRSQEGIVRNDSPLSDNINCIDM